MTNFPRRRKVGLTTQRERKRLYTLERVPSSGGGGGVTSVNGDTGPAVVLDATDVGAVPTTRTVNGQPLSSDIVIATGGIAGYCGDGADGNVTISTPVSLTRDMYYDTLTVASGGTLKSNAYRIYCKTALIVDVGGKVHFDGNNASGVTGGAAVASGSIGGIANAPNGGAFIGSNSSASSNSAFGGKGGNGGAGNGIGLGGTGTAVTTPAAAIGGTLPRSLPVLATGFAFNSTGTVQVLAGGTSGGSGGGDSINGGTGGGAGQTGGVLLINARSVTNNGVISANGGNGSAPAAAGNNKGGGGGGGGGLVIVNTESFTGNAPTATGGTGGTATGTGVAGQNGATGTVLATVWV